MLRLSKRVLTIAVSVCVAGSAFAQDQSGQGRPPAAASTFAATLPSQDLGTIAPAFVFSNASIGTGAVGLRNRGSGGINISGVVTPVKRAFVYWAVVTDGAPPTAVKSILVKRGAANGPFTAIQGVPIGTGQSPCWRGDRTTVYRGIIPNTVAAGNGLYLVLLRGGANGATGGESPWDESNPPLFEGVSIVLIGNGPSKVAVYDTRLAGRMFYGRLAYKLSSPSVASATTVLFHDIGADGQSGVGVADVAVTAGEITFLNGRRIAGPGSAGAGDWNGATAGPLPQLWDNTTHDVTNAAKAGTTPTLLPFVITSEDDCLVTVANVLSIQ